MKRVQGIAEVEAIGDFFFDGSVDAVEGMRFVCKVPGGDIVAIPIHTQGQQPKRPVSWLWDGNVDHPTLQPSLDVKGNNAWHGFVTGGNLITC